MPTYAAARVVRRDDGEYFYPAEDGTPIFWLPCGIERSLETLDARRFGEQIVLPAEHFGPAELRRAERWLETDQSGIVSRFGFGTTALGRQLRRMNLGWRHFECPAPLWRDPS